VGNSTRLEDGMRLRFGDFVLRVELGSDADKGAGPGPAKSKSAFEFSFDPVAEPIKKPKRPEDLPEPFGVKKSGFFDADDQEKPLEPLDRDDPFALNLKPSTPKPDTAPESPGGFFSSPPPSQTASQERRRERPERGGGYFDAKPEPAKSTQRATEPEPPKQSVPAEAAQPSFDDSALRAAFFKGLGLDPDRFDTTDQMAEMEALGRRFRALTDGLVHLLRNRAEEKQKVRVAQTIIGSANVNALKFAVSTDDAVSSLIAERGSGYLDPDTSISDGYRDLIDHQMRTWTALQAALRQMIEKFNPAEIEKEMADTGLLEALIAGGKSAKLWQLYEDRYQEIARAAEERFLGEIGSEFRDAYETKGREGS
ncbi:MAG: type VI secretion system-associated FHA domain protein TagH, partial [Pseudomonadota bacterium]